MLAELQRRHPATAVCLTDIEASFRLLVQCYERDGILYLCGNGGSAADAEHIVGELMKSFSIRRPIDTSALEPHVEELIGKRLEGALRAISLTGHPALSTAFANDVAPDLIFAQQIYGYGRKNDILLALSTSGNSRNILHALRVAKARGMQTIGLTGQSGGQMKDLCDCCICVPETETFKVQELHLPIYHTLCRMLEQHFFA